MEHLRRDLAEVGEQDDLAVSVVLACHPPRVALVAHLGRRMASVEIVSPPTTTGCSSSTRSPVTSHPQRGALLLDLAIGMLFRFDP